MSRYAVAGLASAFDLNATRVPAGMSMQATGGGAYRPVIAAQRALITKTPIAVAPPGPAAYPGVTTVDEQRVMPRGVDLLGPVRVSRSPFAIANELATGEGSASVADATGIATAGEAVESARDAGFTPAELEEIGSQVRVIDGEPRTSTPVERAPGQQSNAGAIALAIGVSIMVVGGVVWWARS